MKIVEHFEVQVPYLGSQTIRRILRRITLKENPPDYIDARLTDEHFPQLCYGLQSVSIDLVSFDWWISHKEDTAMLLLNEGYEAVNAAELLELRASNPQLEHAPPITAPKDTWEDPRGYRFVPCIHAGAGHGIRVRIIDAGWAPFWRFAVKKTESV